MVEAGSSRISEVPSVVRPPTPLGDPTLMPTRTGDVADGKQRVAIRSSPRGIGTVAGGHLSPGVGVGGLAFWQPAR